MVYRVDSYEDCYAMNNELTICLNAYSNLQLIRSMVNLYIYVVEKLYIYLLLQL